MSLDMADGLGRQTRVVKQGSTLRQPCYIRSMRDRLFFPLAILFALAMIAVAMVWPRGMGAATPSFGGAPPPAASTPR